MSEDHNMAGQAGSEPDRVVSTGPRELTVFTKRGVGGKDFRGRRDSDPKARAMSATESVTPSTSKQTVPASLPVKVSPASAGKVLPPPPAPAPSSTDKTSPGNPEQPAVPATDQQE